MQWWYNFDIVFLNILLFKLKILNLKIYLSKYYDNVLQNITDLNISVYT